MAKLMTFLKAPAGADRRAFRSSILDEYAPSRIRRDPSVGRVVVNLADQMPSQMPVRRTGEPAPNLEAPPYDAMIETTYPADRESVAAAHALQSELGAVADKVATYRVTEWIEKERPAPPTSGRVPGVKYVALCSFHDDLTPVGGKRSWALHVPLALRVHVGMVKYVRNWVEDRLSPDCGGAQGIVELHFDAMADLEQRWFDSEQGRAEINRDVGHFMKSAERIFVSEHIVRAS